MKLPLNNKISFVAIGFLCILIIGLLMFSNSNTGVQQPIVGTPMTEIGSDKEKELVSKSPLLATYNGTSIQDDAMSYGDFIKNYGERRIQFDENCRATPVRASFSVGDSIILDNRSGKIQAVKFVDDLYALPPFHVRVFKLERQGIFNIDCGTSKNVSEIIVH